MLDLQLGLLLLLELIFYQRISIDGALELPTSLGKVILNTAVKNNY
jgi:hypothetical protein